MRASSLTCAPLLAALVVGACGSEGENPAPPRHTPPADEPVANDTTTPGVASGSRRLTVHEFNRVLADVLLDTTGWTTTRVEDTSTGYDNDINGQPPASAAYIEETEQAAVDAAARFVANAAAWAALVPCAADATAPGDKACLAQFVAKLGRKLLRRTLAQDEVGRYVDALSPFAVEKNDFKVGAQLVVQTLLQDTEFLYLVQSTRPIPDTPGIVALSGTTRAAQLSFFLWGTTPDDGLLDKAESGQLDSPASVATVAAAMVDDPRARGQVDRFVSMWLGYEKNPAMNADLATEIDHLVERAIFDQDADVTSLFGSTDTFLPSDALADAYGMPHPPPGGGWVPYGNTGRAGILSTGAALTMGAKAGDTSPTQRGKAILDKLLCTPIQRPANINVDQPPAAPDNSPCKVARYKAIAASSDACAGCHAKLDGIGLGLEAYDLHGHFRTHDDANASCAIPGDGDVPGLGAFKGPGELAPLLLKSGQVEPCIVKQAFRYGLGRADTPDDAASLTSLTSQFEGANKSMKKLLVALVSSSTFLTVKE